MTTIVPSAELTGRTHGKLNHYTHPVNLGPGNFTNKCEITCSFVYRLTLNCLWANTDSVTAYKQTVHYTWAKEPSHKSIQKTWWHETTYSSCFFFFLLKELVLSVARHYLAWLLKIRASRKMQVLFEAKLVTVSSKVYFMKNKTLHRIF